MKSNEREQLTLTEQYVKGKFSEDVTGHDYWHMKRVVKNAEEIAREEHADVFICQMAAWLHDMTDPKLFNDIKQAEAELNQFLADIDLSSELKKKILEAMADVSFSKKRIPATIEGKIVQDADRLDAIGAVGIARVFAFGGSKGQPIHNPEQKSGTSIQHFYDKLLKLKELMNTETGRKIADQRHAFMESYLSQFYQEW